MFEKFITQLGPAFESMGYRFDADESAFFERELEHVFARTYDIEYPTLMHRMFIPVETDVDPGAESRTYRQFDRVGNAKFITDNGKDLPRADVFGAEFTGPVREIGIGYGWKLKELMSARLAGRPLNTRRASAARRATEELLDFTACFGAPNVGITSGFLNDANVPVTAATGTWSGLTPDQIIADVSAAYARVAAATLDSRMPDTLLVPSAAYTHISTTPRSTTSDTTILEFLLKAFPLNRIEKWYRLNTAGAGSVPRAVLYELSPEVVSQDIPMEFAQLAPQVQGLSVEVPTWAMTAGVKIPYPLAIDYTDGV